MGIQRVDQVPPPIQPRSGVVALHGFGIRAAVERGHLVLSDGSGPVQREGRFPRVGHGINRVIVIGSDGCVSLAALRWLSDQDAAFVMLERDGKVLATTGPVRPSDARLRRAQANADRTGAALRIACELMSRKLAGQEQVARELLRDSATADIIRRFHSDLATALTISTVRQIESQAAASYWAAWRDVPITFPKRDLPRVPGHWRVFRTRKSVLTGSPRLATDPLNAALNYLYAIGEAECRLAAAALGLDVGIGFVHVDGAARDALCLDLVEAIRPLIDCYVLGWVLSQPLKREWFFEQRDGNCRLMATLAARLAETSSMWARAIGPIVEWVAHELWKRQRKPANTVPPPTRLTETYRRAARGTDVAAGASVGANARYGKLFSNLCRGCGKELHSGKTSCATCAIEPATERLVRAAIAGRVAAHTAEAESRRSDTQRRQATARWAWQSSQQPDWLTQNFYVEKIQPRLVHFANGAIAAALGVSRVYAAAIRRGVLRPHPRHWMKLADLVGIGT